MRCLLPALLFAGAAAGCGERLYTVRGTVTLEDGTPLTRGMVVFERQEGERAIMARGAVQSDGRYELSTHREGDGVPPGKYRVQINHMDLSEVPDEQKKLPYDLKYLTFATSGLEYEVGSGTNEFPIKLEKPRKVRR